MDDIHAAVEECVREGGLVTGHVVAPVGTPVDGDDRDVARPLHLPYPADDPAAAADEGLATKSTPARSPVAAQIRGMPLDGMPKEKTRIRRPPSRGTTAGRRAASASAPAPAVRSPAPAKRVEGVRQSLAAEVQDVVVGQYADVGAGGGQARKVGGVHPVVDFLAGGEIAVLA